MNRAFNNYFNHTELRLKRQSLLNEILFIKADSRRIDSKDNSKRIEKLRLEIELIERQLIELIY